jgi:hypothetical protein
LTVLARPSKQIPLMSSIVMPFEPARDHVEDVRLERRQPNSRAQFRQWLMTMGTQLRHAGPRWASWKRSAAKALMSA